jgi:hydrogenase maturation protein HypF
MAWKFHHTLARALTELLLLGQEKTGLRKVVLGGGVFQNRVLLLLCKRSLDEAGFQVFFSARIPPNDGGLSVGQALVAAWRRCHDVPGHSCTSSAD